MFRTKTEKYIEEQKYDQMNEGKTWCLKTIIGFSVQQCLSVIFTQYVIYYTRVFSLVFSPAHDVYLKLCLYIF